MDPSVTVVFLATQILKQFPGSLNSERLFISSTMFLFQLLYPTLKKDYRAKGNPMSFPFPFFFYPLTFSPPGLLIIAFQMNMYTRSYNDFFFLIHLYLLQLFKAECDLSTTFPFTKLAPSYFSSGFTICLSRLISLLL